VKALKVSRGLPHAFDLSLPRVELNVVFVLRDVALHADCFFAADEVSQLTFILILRLSASLHNARPDLPSAFYLLFFNQNLLLLLLDPKLKSLLLYYSCKARVDLVP
jgi:hypothetical protein